MNQSQYVASLIRQEIHFTKDHLGDKYVFGADGPTEWDCIHFVRKAARAAGLDGSVVPGATNVRMLTKWAEDRNLVRLYADGAKPKRGDIFLWGSPDGDHRPVKGAGHTGLVLRMPGKLYPNGFAISAYNPHQGVITHDLIAAPSTGHVLYGFITPPWPMMPVEPPTVDLEQPPQ